MKGWMLLCLLLALVACKEMTYDSGVVAAQPIPQTVLCAGGEALSIGPCDAGTDGPSD